MLLELRIENLLLIERAELRLGAGLNAITGETGAGKTMLAHSLDLLLGGKARRQIVRPGAEEAWVEGVFAVAEGLFDDPELAELAERLPDGADELVLGRRIGSSGRTSAFIGGRSASSAELRALGSRLVAFYGQHEHRRLTLASAQLEILDGFAGSAQIELRGRYRGAHATANQLGAEIASLRARDGARDRDLDLLRFELTEIEASRLNPDEEAELEADRNRLRHAARLRDSAAGALAAITTAEDGTGGASATLAEADSRLLAVDGVDRGLDELAERVRAAAVEVDDAARGLRSYLDTIEVEPARLEAVEERLEALDRLKRKHGGTIESVLAHAERCRIEIGRLENAEGRADELAEALAKAEADRAALAAKLTTARRTAAGGLSKRVAAELGDLAMEGARLEVVLEAHPQGFGASGAETVELRVATNPGMPVAPLKDAASGGELSRIMLALSGLAAAKESSTLVFDEIDAGVGGSTARAVGARLRRLGEARQVICITHLPQVASLAETHFTIGKDSSGDRTTATVEPVVGEDLVAEIVRMLGGERGDAAASRHAEELLEAA